MRRKATLPEPELPQSPISQDDAEALIAGESFVQHQRRRSVEEGHHADGPLNESRVPPKLSRNYDPNMGAQ